MGVLNLQTEVQEASSSLDGTSRSARQPSTGAERVSCHWYRKRDKVKSYIPIALYISIYIRSLALGVIKYKCAN